MFCLVLWCFFFSFFCFGFYKKELSCHIFMLFYLLLMAQIKDFIHMKTTTISEHRIKLQLANATVPTQIIFNWLT